jgi:hypothetical protein
MKRGFSGQRRSGTSLAAIIIGIFGRVAKKLPAYEHTKNNKGYFIFVACEALGKWAEMYLPELCQATRIHVAHRTEYSSGLRIQSRQLRYRDHIEHEHDVLVQSQVLCHVEAD